LVERDRVRKNSPHVAKAGSGHRNQLVRDADARLADNWQIILEQMIVVLVHASVKGILDGDYRVRHPVPLQGIEHFIESRAGKDLNLRS